MLSCNQKCLFCKVIKKKNGEIGVKTSFTYPATGGSAHSTTVRTFWCFTEIKFLGSLEWRAWTFPISWGPTFNCSSDGSKPEDQTKDVVSLPWPEGYVRIRYLGQSDNTCFVASPRPGPEGNGLSCRSDVRIDSIRCLCLPRRPGPRDREPLTWFSGLFC